MTNMAGSMNNTIGIVSLAPNLCALSSSLMIESRRSSSAIARRAWLNGVPYCRLWLIMAPNRRSPSDVDPSFSNASRRLGNIRRSSRRPLKTRAMAEFDRFISSATRSSPLSRPIPASLHTTSKSMASGVPRRTAAAKRRLSAEKNQSRPHNSDHHADEREDQQADRRFAEKLRNKKSDKREEGHADDFDADPDRQGSMRIETRRLNNRSQLIQIFRRVEAAIPHAER